MFMTKTIISNLLHKYATRLHPAEQRPMAAGNRGNLVIEASKCIACRICANKCPTGVISVDPENGKWEQRINGCVYCGVCADVCPTHCITMTPDYRRPFLEPAFLRCDIKPRPKKVKPAEGAAPAAKEGAPAVKAADEVKPAPEAKAAAKPAVEAKATTEAKPAAKPAVVAKASAKAGKSGPGGAKSK